VSPYLLDLIPHFAYCKTAIEVRPLPFVFRPDIRYLIPMQNRVEVFKQMLGSDPDNTAVMFGLAKEYEKLGHHGDIIEILEKYLEKADDEGNAYGMLAKAYDQAGMRERAIETLRRGIDVSNAHGHPSMANEYKMTLDLDYDEQ
jgi:tetratricopeptide (TPR) repeat protein